MAKNGLACNKLLGFWPLAEREEEEELLNSGVAGDRLVVSRPRWSWKGQGSTGKMAGKVAEGGGREV